MFPSFRTSAITCLLVLLSAPLVAQLPIEAGDRVRLRAASIDGRREGEVVRMDAESLVLVRGRDTVVVPRSELTALWRSTDSRRSTFQGMAIGILVGGGVGALAAAVSYEPCRSTEFLGCLMTPDNASEAALWGGAAGGALGLVLGGAIGALTVRHTWEEIGVESAAAVMPARNGGFEARVTTTF